MHIPHFTKKSLSQKRLIQCKKSREWTPHPEFGNEYPIAYDGYERSIILC